MNSTEIISAADVPVPIMKLLDAFKRKQLDEIMALFSEDAIIYDPHYPVPLMEGKKVIRKGLSWGLGHMKKPGFRLTKIWQSTEGIMLVVDTQHLFNSGKKLDFQQIFYTHIENDLITELRAFVPYRPPGVGGWKARVTGFFWRLKNR